MAEISKTCLHGVLNSVGSCMVRRWDYCTYRSSSNGRRTHPELLKSGGKLPFSAARSTISEGATMIIIQNSVLFAYALGFLFTCILILYMYLDTRDARKK